MIGPANYIARHWLGDLSLSVSFWFNFWVLGFGYNLIAAFLLFHYPVSWPAYHVVIYVVISLALAMQVWLLVGLWRSAKKHTQRGGRWLWGFLFG